MKITDIITALENRKTRSAWDKGVNQYALDLCDRLAEALDYDGLEEVPESVSIIRKMLLNGASDWHEYSWGGCSLIYDRDIAERLCTPSELKKTRNGQRKPNAQEEWLDTQARALFQAAERIIHIINSL